VRSDTALSRNLSIYLDLLRRAAAMAVFLGHAAVFVMPSLPSFISGNAGEAVAVFFVLSGFVISFVANEKEHSCGAYLIARVSRIYSVAILAILITFISDTIGTLCNLNYYLGLSFYNTGNWMNLFKNLTFLNELWYEHSVYGTNEPYWSLAFEVWYYIFFGIVYFLPAGFKLPAVIFWILICGPKISLYLPLWLMWLIGVADYICTMRGYLQIRKYYAAMLMIFTVILYISVKKLFSYMTTMRGHMFEWHGYKSEIVSFIYFMLIGFIIFINIISFDKPVQSRDFWNSSFERWLRWFAGASFTLYLLHMPILILIGALDPDVKASFILGVISILFTLLMILVLAELGERKKSAYAHAISWVFSSRTPPN